ncbi:MAG: trigger factor [Alphaproteobacteria bacterium]|nr:trigger factor [Alphaproteobacteria bacterium]
MKVKELKSDGLSHELEITILANDIDKRVDVKLQEVGKTAKMPGFRPGKVPLSMLKKRYGKAIMGEILEAAVNETSQQALEDKKITPAMQPKIEVVSFDDGKDLVYTVSVEALPEFKVADFKDIKLTKLVAEPEEGEVDTALERIAANNQSSKEVTTKRGAKDGDIVVITFHGRTADDNVEHEGMHAHGHNLTLGSGQFIPGFEEQLVGKKTGDKVEVKVTFPEEYGAKELAGRDAIFDVEIEQLREPAEAEIDDEFAKSLGMDDVKALKEAVKEQLQKELDNHARIVLKKELLDALDEANKFEIPAGMLDVEFENIIQQIEIDKKQRGEEADISDEEKEEYKSISERRVRLGLILAQIGNEQKIVVADAELQKAVISEAQKYPGQEKEVFDYYSKNPQALEQMRAPLFEEKVVDYILELSEVKEKKVSQDELLKALDDEDAEKPKKKSAKKSSAKKDEKKDDKKDDKKPAAKKKSTAKKSTSKK